MGKQWENWFYALCYEIALKAAEKWPSLRFKPWFKLLLSHCFSYWTEYKAQVTLQAVDKQAKELVEQRDRAERESCSQALASKAQELFPDATVTPLPDAIVPSVMIVREVAPNASEEVKALGGEMRITYNLD